ncbi:unnamed protein product, partial [Discosporangium mesarthrocarpum]
ISVPHISSGKLALVTGALVVLLGWGPWVLSALGAVVLSMTALEHLVKRKQHPEAGEEAGALPGRGGWWGWGKQGTESVRGGAGNGYGGYHNRSLTA